MNGCLTAVGILFLLPFVAFIVLIIKLVTKSRNEGWKGEVIDKAHNTKRDFDNHKKIEHFYSLTVRMTDGKERHIGVSGEFWDTCKVGDMVEKPKGSLYPKKVK